MVLPFSLVSLDDAEGFAVEFGLLAVVLSHTHAHRLAIEHEDLLALTPVIRSTKRPPPPRAATLRPLTCCSEASESSGLSFLRGEASLLSLEVAASSAGVTAV